MKKDRRTIKKGKPKGRANPYGICMCTACKEGRAMRHGKDGGIEKIKHKHRTAWKTNKQEEKGIYTD